MSRVAGVEISAAQIGFLTNCAGRVGIAERDEGPPIERPRTAQGWPVTGCTLGSLETSFSAGPTAGASVGVVLEKDVRQDIAVEV